MKVLVTGGAGYIGSIVTEELINSGHDVVVYDNLAKGHRGAVISSAEFVKGDLLDIDLLREILKVRKIEAVVHMAAHSIVGESMQNPMKYYENNLNAGISLLNAMVHANVPQIVFSSTAAVYGEPLKQPIEESDPTTPTNPYGETKLAFERALQWYELAYGIKYTSLRYFNAAGASQCCGEVHDPETHLIPIVLKVAAGARQHVEVYGDDYPTRDGTCVRDYIHVIDLAHAHVLPLVSMRNESGIFNLGCGGNGYSVLEVIRAAEKVSQREIPFQVVKRRAGDPAVLIASSDRIKKRLGWQPHYQDLALIIESSWKWMQEHPKGYEEVATPANS
ncbi:MAG TPA: UDP-glucose 4-epimerase GalE [Acidobacteriota bacterium]|nr:UDP-glucose 4-epimerase GalE [Acidobacteriota bacterium]